MNLRTTVVWTVAFVACDALSVLVHGTAGIWLPVGVLALAVVISRVSGRLYLTSTMYAAEGPSATTG